jgi:hypothetical protein
MGWSGGRDLCGIVCILNFGLDGEIVVPLFWMWLDVAIENQEFT